MNTVQTGSPSPRPARVFRRPAPYRYGQAGDGRERALLKYVLDSTSRHDLDGVIAAIDNFARNQAFLINIGDDKGLILDVAVHRARPNKLLELGTYCGYSALRISRAMPPHGHLYSIERGPANARIATRIWRHAGVGDRISCVIGALGDDGVTLKRLINKYDFRPGTLDFVFIDHAKEEYLPDLRRILGQGWLHPGSIVVADNIKTPGSPAYRDYMRQHEAVTFRTVEHATHLEYRPHIPDMILESEYLDAALANSAGER